MSANPNGSNPAAIGLTGERKSLAAHGVEVFDATFDLDGKSLWFSSSSGTAALTRIALVPGAKAEALSLPDLTEDAIA